MLALRLHKETAVLCRSLFGDVNFSPHLESGNNGLLYGFGNFFDLVQHPVDAVAHLNILLAWLDMYVTGSISNCLLNDQVGQLDHGSFRSLSRFFLALAFGSRFLTFLLGYICNKCGDGFIHAVVIVQTSRNFVFGGYHRLDLAASL